MEEGIYRLFLALQRMENQVPVITALLGRWLTAEEVPSASTSAVGEVLDRLIGATQVRYPVIGDIARNLRFRLFDEPQIRKAREQIYDSVRESLQYLTDNPDKGIDAGRIVRRVGVVSEVLQAFPDALVNLLARLADLRLVEQAEPQVTQRRRRSPGSAPASQRSAGPVPHPSHW